MIHNDNKIRVLMEKVLKVDNENLGDLTTYSNELQALLAEYPTTTNPTKPVVRTFAPDTNDTTRIMVNAKVQLTRIGVGDLNGLVAHVLSRIESKTTNDMATSAFGQSFLLASTAAEYYNLTVQLVGAQGFSDGVILPPLLLRANENMIVKVEDGIVVVSFDRGPLIPVVRRDVVHEPRVSRTLRRLYHAKTAHPKDYVGESNFRTVFLE
jgi:hypothetical protein